MGEYYAVTVGVVKKEQTPITDLNIEVSLPELLSHKVLYSGGLMIAKFGNLSKMII